MLWIARSSVLAAGNAQRSAPRGRCRLWAKKKTISELLEIVKEDRMFYEQSGGGVTWAAAKSPCSPKRREACFRPVNWKGSTQRLRPAATQRREDLLRIAEFVDLFLFDLKQFNPEDHSKWTGVRNERILDNLQELLHRRYNVKIRMPLLKGCQRWTGGDRRRDQLPDAI